MLVKIVGAYRTTAVILANTLLLLLLLNGAFSLVEAEPHANSTNPISHKYGTPLTKVYPGFTVEEINQLLNETWYRTHAYEPYTQFKERPYSGRYVTVSSHGYRAGAVLAPWPLYSRNFNIFLFGGSTTFGFGVPDHQTIGSYLQQRLSLRWPERRVRVYNFGRSPYYSTQERILFEQLLSQGHVPDAAIFLDGLNEFYHTEDRPLHTERLEHAMQGAAEESGPSRTEVLETFALGRWVNALARRVAGARDQGVPYEDPGSSHPEYGYDDPLLLDRILDRYMRNKRLIEAAATAYEVPTTFVWQPVPHYNYDLRYHLFARRIAEGHTYSKFGYPRMRKRVQRGELGDNFLWCADLQKDIEKPLYVDAVHYTAEMSEMIADVIAEFALDRPPGRVE